MKNKLRHLITLALALGTSISLAQTPEVFSELTCPSTQAATLLLAEDKNYAKEQALFESYYQNYVQDLNTSQTTKSNIVYTIPTVVHIVHSCAELGTINNPSDAQIIAIMEEVNKRFRQTHSTARSYTNPNYGVDAEIELCLVDVDPSGNYTTGIVRHPDAVNHIGGYSILRATYASAYRWDRTKYFNIFIATDITDASGVYVGGSGSDFIICDAPAFNAGLVMHETGHYFSLKHTFGGCSNNNCLADGDFVCDTPPKSSSGMNGGTCDVPNNNCTTDDDDTATYNPYRPVSSGGLGDQPDMLENYMDYTSSCWDAFTAGQKVRMHANIEGSRMTQVAHAAVACNNSSSPARDIAVLNVTTNLTDCAGSFSPNVSFQNNGTTNLTSATIVVDNAGTTRTTNWTGNLAVGASTSVSVANINLVSGINTITATASAPNGSSDGFSDNNVACTTVAYPSATGLSLPFVDDFSGCALNPFYSLSNGDDVVWSISNYSSPAGLTDCQDCYARVLGFATPAETAQFCLPKFDFSNAFAPKIEYALGHIPRYTFITNRLTMKVSAECGIPSTVWTGSALDLSTNAAMSYSPNSAYLYPDCTEMLAFEVDLSAFANMTNVEICFEANGRWYSPLILDEISVSDIATKHLAIKTILSGPYNNNLGIMNANIRGLGNFPRTEPYTDMGYNFVNGGGEKIDVSVLYDNTQNAIVDWVVVEIRSATNPTTIISSRAGLLQSDGDIVDLDGKSPLSIAGVTSGNHYVAIRHRNHLGAMTLVNIQ